MTPIRPAMAAAFAAFCIWLGVRIVNRRERWAKSMLAGLCAAVLYPISAGFWVAYLAFRAYLLRVPRVARLSSGSPGLRCTTPLGVGSSAAVMTRRTLSG
jgi:hypothetical protein